MTRRQALQARRRALETAPQLQPFVLLNVTPNGITLGSGSYGSVQEVVVNGLVCAGKTLHNILFEDENEGAERIVQKYTDECQLMSSLCHPHIVQFLGICFLPSSELPVLVMERLSTNLHNLLESNQRARSDIPLAMKCSVLQDVARGLVYLHNHKPAITHRDLTASNVLVNSSMVAKIADLGNSRNHHCRSYCSI